MDKSLNICCLNNFKQRSAFYTTLGKLSNHKAGTIPTGNKWKTDTGEVWNAKRDSINNFDTETAHDVNHGGGTTGKTA